eukprot:m.291782 g.291782  ORF g.291782 m.291782 type:complete len:330 (+) comp19985_c0_seq5:452-1441(+)
MPEDKSERQHRNSMKRAAKQLLKEERRSRKIQEKKIQSNMKPTASRKKKKFWRRRAVPTKSQVICVGEDGWATELQTDEVNAQGEILFYAASDTGDGASNVTPGPRSRGCSPQSVTSVHSISKADVQDTHGALQNYDDDVPDERTTCGASICVSPAGRSPTRMPLRDASNGQHHTTTPLKPTETDHPMQCGTPTAYSPGVNALSPFSRVVHRATQFLSGFSHAPRKSPTPPAVTSALRITPDPLGLSPDGPISPPTRQARRRLRSPFRRKTSTTKMDRAGSTVNALPGITTPWMGPSDSVGMFPWMASGRNPRGTPAAERIRRRGGWRY